MPSYWAISVSITTSCIAWATIQAPGNGTVHGEVYRIDNATLAELDALRTRGGEYARQLIQTPYGSAWMYVYQRPVDGLKLIESGDWLDRDK